MARRKTKYTLRADGRIVLTKTINGERKCFYGHSDEEVEAKRDAYIAKLAEKPKPKTMTFGEVADLYWEKKEPKLSPNSIPSYTSRLKEAKEEFGALPIDEIEQWQVLDYLSRIASQGYAQKGVSNRRSMIKSIFDFAVSQKNIPLKANPCISMPAVIGKKGKKRRPASEADVIKIEEHKTDSLMSRMYYFMEYTGCRIGEASVLQQKHIDIDHHKAVVVQDLAFRGQNPEVKPRPKSEAGDREVDLYDNVIEILPHYNDPNTFIFFPEGLPTRSGLATLQKNYKKATGVSATAHQLRHTYAGIMHSAEIDAKDTQARLGHANIATTQDIYTEIERQHNEKQRNKANAFIIGERLRRPVPSCPACGSLYTKAPDGHAFTFCPDCGKKFMLSKKVVKTP